MGWPKPDLSLTAPLDPSVWYLARCCSSGCKTKLSSTLPSEDREDNCAVRGGFPWDMVCLRTLVLRLHGWGVPSTHNSDVEVLLPLKIKRFNQVLVQQNIKIYFYLLSLWLQLENMNANYYKSYSPWQVLKNCMMGNESFHILPCKMLNSNFYPFLNCVKMIKQILLERLNWREEWHIPEGDERRDGRCATGPFAGWQLLSLVTTDINMQPLAIDSDLALHHLCENRWTLLSWACILALGSLHCHKIL